MMMQWFSSSEYRLWRPNTGLEPTPRFEFTPTIRLQSCFGSNVRFIIANQLELIMQLRGLMADGLEIEVLSKRQLITVLWLRFDTSEFNNRGSAPCYDVNGICGYLEDSKEI